MGLIVRLGPVVLLALVVGIWLWRRHRNNRAAKPPALETITSPAPVQLPATAAVTVPRTRSARELADAGIHWPDDVEVPTEGDADAVLDRETWRGLCTVLNGQGEGPYAHLLGKNGRFRTRNGARYTLFRTGTVFNGSRQSVCVVVKITCDGNVNARRIIVSLDKAEVRFIDEERIESPSLPKGICHQQATTVEAAGMMPMATSAVMLLTHELAAATRYGQL